MSEAQPSSRFYAKSLPLPECRELPQLDPAPHQARALKKLDRWYANLGRYGGGGVLVLPTGGGKTFTAVRFLCAGPLSDGYKVLWLAHTHHLLEQAFDSFREETVGSVREPRRALRLRVVSGTPGHFPPRDVRPDDDVVIATLQTVTHAYREQQKQLMSFLRAAGKKLFVVFDEAHHAPAPSYRKLLQALQATPAPVLGLTATPLYSDESRQGWLKKLFPDGILDQARATDLIAAGVLARPKAVPVKTAYTPTFNSAEYAKWLGTFKDVPEHVIDALADNKERNAFIAKVYADNRKQWGKTIIFTDRWFQCEAIAEALGKHGVKAGSVYSHVDARPSTVAQRQRRDPDENKRVLDRFRKGEIQVLTNVRMLTEGTDIPDVKTVFLTRQTTSRILLTQMVGRALRGPKFRGTAEAYIVSFEDDWRQQIQWAEFELADGGTKEGTAKQVERPPLQLISIDLVKKLARQMTDGINITPGPFQTLIPVGWFRTQFDARIDGSDDVEYQDLLVMVFEDERKAFDALIKKLLASVLESLASEDATLDQHRGQIEGWRNRFFEGASRNASDLDADIFLIARHVAQQRDNAPRFYPFEMRVEHDLDKLAESFIDRDLGPRAIDEALRAEYDRPDRFWRTLFHRYEQLRHFYEGCQTRILSERRGEVPGLPPRPAAPPHQLETPSISEPDEQVKTEVKERDGYVCLACGARRSLQVDHIVSVYHGGSNEPGNLQTLCGLCNRMKGTTRIDFANHATQLQRALSAFPAAPTPRAADAANPEQWEKFLRRTINFFFQCAAVDSVEIAGRGDGYYNWKVTLMSGNRPDWLTPHLPDVVERIQRVRDAGRKPRIASLRIEAPGHRYVVHRE
ncbi:DEAD/DEAH box helicase family protein [Polyangium spumosum]|uniref:DEAD/DEAH box helicase family protein n=1 Tax=Polyangium spumosum TaxID=889282 RepID=UPI001478B154|nr:DEAD/DEAH box helicase family protein [Polyangium spumosum]